MRTNAGAAWRNARVAWGGLRRGKTDVQTPRTLALEDWLWKDSEGPGVNDLARRPELGGGSLRAFRRAILSDPGNDNHKESAATKTSKSTFCCCGLWRLQGQNIVSLVFVAAISCSHPQKPKRRGTQKRKGRVVENPRPKSSNLPKILPKPFQNHPKPSQNPPKIVPKPHHIEGN